MKGDHMGILAAYPTQRELPLSNRARFSSCAIHHESHEPLAERGNYTTERGQLNASTAEGDKGAAGTRPNIALSRRHRSEARSVSEPMNIKHKLMQIIRSNRSAADGLFWTPFARGFERLGGHRPAPLKTQRNLIQRKQE